jgi:DNA-directed RNA polymerase beta' subunit
LKIEIIPIEEFIKINNLQEISNPVMFEKGSMPTSDGLLSTDIFGVNTRDRKDTYAYIDLNGYFFHPHVYKLLKRMNKKFESIAFGTKKYIIKNGVIEENEEGETGLVWLYKNWDNIKFEKNLSRIRNERVDLLDALTKKEIFTRYWIIIPPFYRDINIQAGNKAGGYEVINEMYSKLIRNASMLKSSGEFEFVMDSTRGRTQELLVEIYDKLKGKIEKKQGIIKKSLMGKNVDYGARLVISAPSFKPDRQEDMEIDFFHTGIPLANCCSLFTPFIIKWVKDFLLSSFVKAGNKIPVRVPGTEEFVYLQLDNPETHFNEEYIKKQIDKFIFSYGDRFDRVEVPVKESESDKYKFTKGGKFYLGFSGRFFSKDEPETQASIFKRQSTWCDLLYMAAVDVTSDKHVYITRYPILDYFGSFPSKITVLSTIETTPVYVEDKLYKSYPKVDLTIPKSQVAVSFSDTLVMSNLYLSGLGGDYDGDQCSVKGVFSQEANQEAHDILTSVSNILNIYGNNIRTISNEGIQTFYMLTKKKNK